MASPPEFSGVNLDPIPGIIPRRDPADHDPPPSEDGSDPPLSNAQLSVVGASKRGFDQKLKQDVWLLAGEFSDSPTLLKGPHTAKIDKEHITILTLDALMQRCTSMASTRGVIRNVSRPIRFFLETRDDSKPGVKLAGDTSVVLLRDYIQSVAERCRTVPCAVKRRLIRGLRPSAYRGRSTARWLVPLRR